MNLLAMSEDTAYSFEIYFKFPFGKLLCKKTGYENITMNNLKLIPGNIYDKQVFVARTLCRGRNKQRKVFLSFCRLNAGQNTSTTTKDLV